MQGIRIRQGEHVYGGKGRRGDELRNEERKININNKNKYEKGGAMMPAFRINASSLLLKELIQR